MTAPAPDAARVAPAPHHETDWRTARRIARDTGRPRPPVDRPLRDALGDALAAPLTALTDLPAFDTAAMDGWAVAGPGPWRRTETGALLAGHGTGAALADGEAVPIATGAPLPPGATGVLRREHGETGPGDAGPLRVREPYPAPGPGHEVRPRGQECRAGERLLERGTVVGPPVLALAAAAGYDVLPVVPRPRVDVLVLGDELLTRGLPDDGRVRDALGPLLPPWLRRLGARAPEEPRRIGDDAEALRQAVAHSTADLIITTGGTAAGPADFVRPVLAGLKARVLVDGVAVRPGHPMLLAVLPSGRPLVGLPGNPLAAVSGVLTLVEPLLRTLTGRADREPRSGALEQQVPGHPHDTRLVPVAFRSGGRVAPLRFHGPAMLRGLAEADAMAVVPPGGAPAGTEVELLLTP
ncbi:molybdopterin molybdotransferase MoeA [Streptantibioticus silvisoli]|uniref:Molybdopterin molybdenumtransferase n=1 Tax=Streptantibioticus silvisoli TaxID=2705255 RepID=A0ABT6W0L2_9ACTN|nr:molybdopterin molybdotransferase MoeA [Streptantibioticus silvisoli]MDI5964283.1 molybdopterin molybdotransferase MoeA [Streptantibioticus silvisoli]